jgi:hypothetical protein
MAQAIVVTLNQPLPDAEAVYAKAKAGKALARESDKLDFTARKKNVAAITSLLSENPAVLAAKMEAEGFNPAKMRLPAERWYSAAEGLVSVRGLIEQVTADLNDFKQPNPILRDLRASEALLVAAESAGVQFHFTKTEN